MTLNAPHVLAYMLLHEVGHIEQGNAAGDFSNGAWSQLNIDPSLAKVSEEKADEFAAHLIRDVASRTDGSASLTAAWISLSLSSLSWNMQAHRTLDEFGATALGKPQVFFDTSYSHPNLAWRILRSNHLIRPSAATKALLDAFEEARERGAAHKPIYQSP